LGFVHRADRGDLNRPRLGIQGSHDANLLACERVGLRLVAQLVDGLAGEQNVLGAVRDHAHAGALCVGRSHAHDRVAVGGAHTVSDRAGEGVPALRGGEADKREGEEACDERFHRDSR
jgi:hypothetical protein